MNAKQFLCVAAVVAASTAQVQVAHAAGTTYDSRSAFEASIGASVTDDYENVGYQSPANVWGFTDSEMNAVLNETRYHSITFPDNNLVWSSGSDHHYCAGCNGEYEMDFTATSVGTSKGVFGVGFDVLYNVPSFGEGQPMHALVKYGDGSSQDFSLPLHEWAGPSGAAFFGVTSTSLISSISILNTGGAEGNFVQDNLTVAAAVPEAGSLALFGFGAAVLPLFSRRKRQQA